MRLDFFVEPETKNLAGNCSYGGSSMYQLWFARSPENFCCYYRWDKDGVAVVVG